MDFHCDGKVNYSEFLAATISSINFCKEEKLWLAFKYFDTTDSGFITLDSVIDALKESGVVVDEQGLNETFIGMKTNDESEIKDNTLSINDKYSTNERYSNNLITQNIVKEKLLTKNTVKHADTKVNNPDD